MDENTPQGRSKRPLFTALLILLLILAGAFIYKKRNTPNTSPDNQQSTAQTKAIATKDVPKTELPETFPSNIPLESGATVTVNYQKQLDAGQTQAVRAFISKKTVADNYQIYTNFLQQNGWQLQGQINQPAFKSLDATKDSNKLDIVIQQNADKTVTVNIMYTSK